MSPLVRLVTQCFHTCNINCRLVLVSPETSQHVFSDLAWTPMCPMRDTRWYVTSLCLMNGDKLQMSSCASTRAMSSSHAGPRQSMELRSVATCKLLWWTSHLARRSFHQLRVRRDKWSPWAPTAVSTVKTEASCEARGSSHQRQITLNVGQPKCVLLPLVSPSLFARSAPMTRIAHARVKCSSPTEFYYTSIWFECLFVVGTGDRGVMCQIPIWSVQFSSVTARQNTRYGLHSWETILDMCGHTQFPAVCIKVIIESGQSP